MNFSLLSFLGPGLGNFLGCPQQSQNKKPYVENRIFLLSSSVANPLEKRDQLAKHKTFLGCNVPVHFVCYMFMCLAAAQGYFKGASNGQKHSNNSSFYR